MRIEVTQADIDNGSRGCRLHCPVAIAIKRTLNLEWCSVITTSIKAGELYCPTPYTVEQFIYNYDQFNTVQPFSFDLPD